MVNRKFIFNISLFVFCAACSSNDFSNQLKSNNDSGSKDSSCKDFDASDSYDASIKETSVDNVVDAESKDALSCVSPGDFCENSYFCCENSKCVYDNLDEINVCATLCLTNSECRSGCCSDYFSNNFKVCAPNVFCRIDAGLN